MTQYYRIHVTVPITLRNTMSSSAVAILHYMTNTHSNTPFSTGPAIQPCGVGCGAWGCMGMHVVWYPTALHSDINGKVGEQFSAEANSKLWNQLYTTFGLFCLGCVKRHLLCHISHGRELGQETGVTHKWCYSDTSHQVWPQSHANYEHCGQNSWIPEFRPLGLHLDILRHMTQYDTHIA